MGKGDAAGSLGVFGYEGIPPVASPLFVGIGFSPGDRVNRLMINPITRMTAPLR